MSNPIRSTMALVMIGIARAFAAQAETRHPGVMGSPHIDRIGRCIEDCSKRLVELAELSIATLSDYGLSGRCEVALCCIVGRPECVFSPTESGAIPGEGGCATTAPSFGAVVKRVNRGKRF